MNPLLIQGNNFHLKWGWPLTEDLYSIQNESLILHLQAKWLIRTFFNPDKILLGQKCPD